MLRRPAGAMLALVVAIGAIAGTPAPAGAAASTSPVYHVPVLMYHRVAPASELGDSLPGLVVDPAAFEAQLQGLQANGWHTITSSRLAVAVLAGQPVAPRTFVITLDDGRDDGYRYAYPILRRLGFTATFFVVTDRVDRPGNLTWDEMNEMVSAGMEIGNHTVSHASPLTLTRARAGSEVRGAQEAITSHLGVTPVSFAYPFGEVTPDLRSAVAAAGLEIAYTTIEGARETIDQALLSPRFRVTPASSASRLLAMVTTAAYGIDSARAAASEAASREGEPGGTNHAGRPARFAK